MTSKLLPNQSIYLPVVAVFVIGSLAIIGIFVFNVEFQHATYVYQEEEPSPLGGTLEGFFAGKDSPMRGGITKRRDNGELEWTCFYNKDGQRDGQLIHYYPNGNPAAMTTFVDGVQEGIALVFHPNGALKQIEWWRNGELIQGSQSAFPKTPVNSFMDAIGEEGNLQQAMETTSP